MSARDASIRERAAFDFIRYGSVWEDADILCEALAPVAPGKRLLSIASAGDNALALLTLDPAQVVAADLSAAQLACVELRVAAFRRLDDAGVLAFLGLEPSPRRLATYNQLRGELSIEAQRFWDAHHAVIERGAIHGGKFERYLRAFRRFVLPLVHSPGTLAQLTRSRTLEQQREFYRRRWDTRRWRLIFRLFFSRAVMGWAGRDPEFFAHVQGPVGERILGRSRHALTEIPVATNPYLLYIMSGNFPPEARPRYLKAEHMPTIRARLDRLMLSLAPIEKASEGRFDGFNLSDIFEYMSPAELERCYGALLERANPGARFAYWNMLAPRARPEPLATRARPLDALAQELHTRDRAWFYSFFRIDEVMA